MTDGAATAVQDVAYAGLDALLVAVPFELCAYLHVGEQLGPQLYLRRPTLAELEPADAFRLFSALRDQLDAPTDGEGGERRLEVEGFDAIAAVSSGSRSRGLWVAGRRPDGLADSEAQLARQLGDAVMRICHAAETVALGGARATVARVSVESAGESAVATVVVDHEGAERTGRADGAAAIPAVASATLDALDRDLKLIAAAEDGLDELRVVLVLARDGLGRASAGAALVGVDPLRAAAAAALDAAFHLTR